MSHQDHGLERGVGSSPGVETSVGVDPLDLEDVNESGELVVEEVVEVGYTLPSRILVDGTHVIEGDGGDLD